MGVRLPFVSTTAIVNTNVVTTAETLIATAPPFSPSFDGTVCRIDFYGDWLAGASVTSVTLRLRRGPLVTSPTVFAHDLVFVQTAAAQGFATFFYVDQPGSIGGQQYSVSAIFNAATANSTIQDVCMTVMAL